MSWIFGGWLSLEGQNNRPAAFLESANLRGLELNFA
jgi:hypothetical protein